MFTHSVPVHPAWASVRPSAKLRSGLRAYTNIVLARCARQTVTGHCTGLPRLVQSVIWCSTSDQSRDKRSVSFLAHIQFCLSFYSSYLTNSLPSFSVWPVCWSHGHHGCTAAVTYANSARPSLLLVYQSC
jgi:hypothetical protein